MNRKYYLLDRTAVRYALAAVTGANVALLFFAVVGTIDDAYAIASSAFTCVFIHILNAASPPQEFMDDKLRGRQ